LSVNKHKTEEEVALIAIDQIVTSLNSLAETQKAMCQIVQGLLFELSNGQQGKKLEED
jgi:uncharacterized protein YejL (UPF0352 family)